MLGDSPQNVARRIELWFAEHDGDGEFALADDSMPLKVIEPTVGTSHLLYTTKPHLVGSAIERSAAARRCGMVGRYELPRSSDLPSIRTVAADRAVQFLGDLDPPDLLIFAWLRAQLSPLTVVHLGINDTYLASLGIHVPGHFYLRSSESERAAQAAFDELLPDARELIGPNCLQLLNGGQKMEFEAIVSATDSRTILPPDLDK